MDFNSRSSPLEHGGLLLLAIDGVALLLSFNSGGEEVFPKHCLVTTWSSCEEPTKQDDGVVLTWNAQVRGDPGPSIYTTGSPFQY